ncbi:zinc-binding dehydrogenase [Streptomyces mirabilis]|uniref:zinc-binding dehydrogenase n=1 Tax=Streptomyces mirabilis TaxID=68239 RepID=UPI0033AF5875
MLISASEHDFADRVQEVTGGLGADVIVDHVGGPYLLANIRAAAVRGPIVGVGRLRGAEGDMDMEELARKRLEITGTTFRTRTPDEKAEVVRALRAGIDLNSAADAFRPVIDRTCPPLGCRPSGSAAKRSDGATGGPLPGIEGRADGREAGPLPSGLSSRA